MKHIFFLLIVLSFSANAQVGFGVVDPTAGLEIGTTADGISAMRLTPQSNPQGTQTGQLSVIDNLLYVFDGDRGKWLSVEETILEFGRLGNGSAPSEIEFSGDLKDGPRMPFDGTIVSIVLSATEDDDSREIGLFLNGIAVPNNSSHPEIDGVYSLDSSSLTFVNTNFDFNFQSGDMLSMALKDANVNDIENLIVTLIVRWRKDN